MAVTQAQIDALDVLIAEGVRQVTLPGGQSTTYNTAQSLIAARDDLKAKLAAQEAAASTTRRRGGITYVYYAGRNY